MPSDIVERLRGRYPVGEGSPLEFGYRQFPVEPIKVEAADEIESLRSRLAEAERDADQLLKERDHAEGMADKLADALATMLCVDIGEHSSGNCPWTEALEAFEERATDSASVEGEK